MSLSMDESKFLENIALLGVLRFELEDENKENSLKLNDPQLLEGFQF